MQSLRKILANYSSFGSEQRRMQFLDRIQTRATHRTVINVKQLGIPQVVVVNKFKTKAPRV